MASVILQSYRNFRLHLAVDKTTDEVLEACRLLSKHPQSVSPFNLGEIPIGTVKFWPNNGDRLYAVGNTARVIDSLYEDNTIIGIIDSDDQLCERRTLEWINSIYKQGMGAVWTSNIWEPYGINLCSNHLDDSVNVYEHPWVSSHFRTFPLSTYQEINPKNFKDDNGEWMKRCEDQTFMLPIIHQSHKKDLRTFYLEKPCYLYRGYQEIGGEEHQYQLSLEKFIRNRGFVE